MFNVVIADVVFWFFVSRCLHGCHDPVVASDNFFLRCMPRCYGVRGVFTWNFGIGFITSSSNLFPVA